jgi:hypothetical protein
LGLGGFVEVVHKLRLTMARSSWASQELDHLRDMNEVVRTAIGQELRKRCSVAETLPNALVTLVNQLDDQQKPAR